MKIHRFGATQMLHFYKIILIVNQVEQNLVFSLIPS